MGTINPPIIEGHTYYHADTTGERSPVPSGFCKQGQSNPAMFHVNGRVPCIQKGTRLRNAGVLKKEVSITKASCMENGENPQGTHIPRPHFSTPRPGSRRAAQPLPSHERWTTGMQDHLVLSYTVDILARLGRDRQRVSFPRHRRSKHLPRRYPASLFAARDEYRCDVMAFQQCGCLQGFDHVDRRGPAVASSLLRAGAMAPCPQASDGGAIPWTAGTTVERLLWERCR